MNTRKILYLAVLVALMLVLQLTGIGLINLGVINVTLYCTVIAIGELTLGLYAGVALGGIFGIISLLKALQAPTGLVVPIMTANPVYAAGMSLLPRLILPFVLWGIDRIGKDTKLAQALAAAGGSLCNTLLYLGMMLMGYRLFVTESTGVLGTVGTIALTAGIPEAIAAALITPPVVYALRKTIAPVQERKKQ